MSTIEIYHYGVKGQKWGVRRYQYADGSLTPQGKKRYYAMQDPNVIRKVSSLSEMKVGELVNNAKTRMTGKQYVDTYLSKGTTFSRIQTSKDFEKYAFYATYKNHDSNEYMGLFGKNLKDRARAEAKSAEKIAKKTKNETDMATAKELKNRSDNLKVYQLKISSTKKLKVPSDENASHITASLLKEKQFKDDVAASISDSKEKMRRPSQQLLFNQAQNAMKKDPSKLTSSEKIAIYKALNLSLTNHNPQEVAAQNRFYQELKKKGYNALLDYNDKEYSSYHAKRPMIVFDTDSVKLQAVTETNPKIVNQMYRKYNAERIMKEIPANTIDYITKLGSKSVSECYSYTNSKERKYLR